MWDVAWTDPKRELVGEHRGKKDKDRSLTEKSLSRNSISTTSSKTSGHSALSRFRVRALRQSSSSKESSKPNMYSPSEPRTPDNSIDTRSSAAMSDTEQRNARDPLKLHAVLRAESTPSNFSSSMRRSKNTNMKKTKNKVPARSASIGSSAAQSNDGDIFSTKGKEKEKTPIIEHSNGSLKQHGVIGICPQRPDLQSPIRRSFAASPLLPPRSLSRLCPVTLQNEPVKAVPLITSQMQPIRKPVLKFSPIDDISMWRSPREWSAATETKDSIRKIETVTGVKAKKPETVCSARLSNPCDSAAEVKQMAQAKPSTALSKLKTSVEDALSLEDTQKVNEEKKRWMLSVLHHLDRSKRHDSIDANILRNGPEMLEQATGRNILAAYEPSCILWLYFPHAI
ncbi:hypothetical protein ED733_004658 [Metarhizium rileyi]|uniref:Uncharacterized protein n=1 Tax=Metarhizium rileyi (strain RCEF 4871) TaxID=1649241 RepID=A0A5C6GD16_METRR|nr:hypothetical protein ED733_004658 [Metarhizium rileyi]